MNELLARSLEIYENAVRDFQPYAVVLMMSGGKDSMTTAAVAKALGIKVDFVMHGRTGTGIKETTDYVRRMGPEFAERYIEADAGNSYEEYVLRKGFFGLGLGAHTFAYHVLKHGHFTATISREIRQRKRKRNILLLNGARVSESANRKNNLKEVFNIDPNVKANIWVNLIHHWPTEACRDFLLDQRVEPNPVTQVLCRSGECMCGTTQSKADALEAAYFFPEWGEWLENLKRQVAAKGYPFSWGERPPKRWRPGSVTVDSLPANSDFQPACVRCISHYEEAGDE